MSKQTTHVSPNEYLLDRQTCEGIENVLTLVTTQTKVHNAALSTPKVLMQSGERG